MNLRTWAAQISLVVLVATVPIIRADTYATFQTTRYYSANRHYFVTVTEKKTATLFRNGRTLSRIWRRTLPELPGMLMVADDGQRVIVIERYYGNDHQPKMKAITTLDETGREIASYQLQELANLEKVRSTISAWHWYGGAGFSQDSSFFEVTTVVAKSECPPTAPTAAEVHDCWQSVPYEQLRFELATGKLIERRKTR